jgi:ABC-type Na+ efflux pump permease subunit
LHCRTWKERLVKWSWFLAISFAASLLLWDSVYSLWTLPHALRLLGIGLLANIAFTSTSCFRQDLESGTMELLMVTPLSDRRILHGRLAGVAMQYAPSVAILLLVWLAVYFDLPERFYLLRHELHWFEPVIFLSSAATLLITGARQSLAGRPAFPGWVMAVVTSLLVPAVLASSITSALHSAGLWPTFPDTMGRQVSVPQLLWIIAFVSGQFLVAAAVWARARKVMRAAALIRSTT